VGGGAILWAMDWLSWQKTFLILAAIVALNTIPVLIYREPVHQKQQPINPSKKQSDVEANFFDKIKSYSNYFFENHQIRAWFFVLCTIKIADGLAGPITKPLMVDLGLSLSQIGIYITMLGAFAALLGAGLAGLLLKRMKRDQALIIFSILKLTSVAGFVWLAALHEHSIYIAPWMIYLIHALEDLFAAMLLVVVLTLVMQYSRSEHAGTDFTLQVSIMATVSGVLYTISGVIGDQLGYLKFMSVIFIVGLICLIPIFSWAKNSTHQ